MNSWKQENCDMISVAKSILENWRKDHGYTKSFSSCIYCGNRDKIDVDDNNFDHEITCPVLIANDILGV